MSDDRWFTMVLPNGKEAGRFQGKAPSRAAQKAGNEILKETKKSAVTVCLRETTRGAKNHAPRSYRVQRVRKSTPVDTGYATFKYDVTAKSLRKSKASKTKASKASKSKTPKKASKASKSKTPKKSASKAKKQSKGR